MAEPHGSRWAATNARKRVKRRAAVVKQNEGAIIPVAKKKGSPFGAAQNETYEVEYKAHEPKDIYTLLDTKARDWRTILIALLAAELALLVQLVNCFYDDKKIGGGLYFFLMVVIGCIIAKMIVPEINETIRQARWVRSNYIENRNAVPMVDEPLLPKKPSLIGKAFGIDHISPKAFRQIIAEDITDPSKDMTKK